jgi:UDP-2,3-diacylglucosamine hydrolase
MAPLTKTLFISDLHLSADDTDELKIFLNLLKNCENGVDAIYILGDLFDTWIGDDDDNETYHHIIQALQKLTSRKIPIYLLHGNRDFLIGKKFLKKTGITLLPDESEAVIYGTHILLLHGDTLCINDIHYIKARKWLRNRFLQTLFLLLPLGFRQKLAQKMREKSKQHTHSTPLSIMDADQNEIEFIMKKHSLRDMIHGHTHRPAIHYFNLDHSPARRMVLGAWHGKGSVLEWNASHEIKLIEI